MTVTKACRLYAGLTQQELGDAVGVHAYLIKDIEKVPPAPSGSAYKLVADYLGLPCDVVCRMISPLSRQASLPAGRSRHMHLSLWKITSVSAAKGRNLS